MYVSDSKPPALIDDSAVQRQKASEPMELTALRPVMEVRRVQFLNASCGTAVVPAGHAREAMADPAKA